MTEYSFDAVIFDLDGVITKTALVHSAAWKKMFDDFLMARAETIGEPFIEFSHEKDYLPYVDGKPRYKGVQSFLESRNISLPYGSPEDKPGKETICGLGNRKNQAFNEVLDRDGVEVYESTVALMKDLREKGFRVGVASSSKNCEAVLTKAGLLHLVETRVDGVVSADLGLQGKPEPDIFTTAADNLGVDYDRSVVVEDAVSGVQAGKKGNFGLVLGIARENNEYELKVNGADIVVKDIDDIGLNGIFNWFEEHLDKDNWSISYDDYVPGKEKTRETLLTIGNGYFGTRGTLEESKAGEFNYPGTYIAGLYNRLSSRVGDREIENEDFVNTTNWIPVDIKINDGDWIDLSTTNILSIHRNLNLRNGVLSRKMVLELDGGKKLEIVSKRLASMADPHLAAMEYSVKPLNFTGQIGIRTGLDGRLINDGVNRYRQLNQKHLEPVNAFAKDGILGVVVKTVQSDVHVATCALVQFSLNGEVKSDDLLFESDGDQAFASITVQANSYEEISFTKQVSIYSSQEWDDSNPESASLDGLKRDFEIDQFITESELAWGKIWDKIDVSIEGDRLAQKLLRLHMYHLMVSFSPHNATIDASITARGLHGEAYRGHIFWDELFILPFYNLHFPEVTKSALLYRYYRLPEAKKYAENHGYKGAMYPWQSGSDGREETQVVHLNPLTGKWGEDFSSYQRHVSLAIAYNIWQYFHGSEDYGFMEDQGAEMFFEICRFWASKAIWSEKTSRYSIGNVMGPDEFHEMYPGSHEGGLSDNAYTNIMVAWIFGKAKILTETMDGIKLSQVLKKMGLAQLEMDKWQEIASKLNVVIDDDIIAQYDGYFKLKELDWEYYRKKYGNIYRMDRLLKSEGKSADDYKVAKQADTLQTFYNLNESTVTDILQQLDYSLSQDYLSKNLNYYLKRTSHGSTLSRVVHAQLANMIEDNELSWELYHGALTSDYADIQGGTTGEGIHAGVMAGTLLIALQSFAGVDLRGQQIKINPSMPVHWRQISFGFNFKGDHYQLDISKEAVAISAILANKESIEVSICERKVIIKHGQTELVNL